MRCCMLRSFSAVAAIAAVFFTTSIVSAAIIHTQWTFDSPPPSNPPSGTGQTISGILPSTGIGEASGFHASSATTWSSPVGNGTSNSFSSNNWAVGDYYQFQTSTLGAPPLSSVEFSATGSNTGPANFDIAYSIDGTTFTQLATYSITNDSWSSNPDFFRPQSVRSFDLSGVPSLNNQASIYFRLRMTDTTSIGGGTVGTGGTSRVDAFTVFVIPEPASAVLMLLASVALIGIRRRTGR